MAEMTLPIITDDMTVVEALQALRALKTRAGARRLPRGGYGIVTAEELAQAADGKPNWAEIRVSALGPARRIAQPESEEASIFQSVQPKRDFVVAPPPATGKALPDDAVRVIAQNTAAAAEVLGARQVCRCSEAFHNVSPPTCIYDGSAVECC